MSALERRWRARVAAVAALLLLGMGNAGTAQAEMQRAPDALPQLWGVEVDGPTASVLDGPVLKQLRRADMLLVASPRNLSAGQRRRTETLAARWSLRLFSPLAVRRAVPAAKTACVELKRARPGSRCGLQTGSLAVAAALTRIDATDVVVVRADSTNQVMRLSRRSRSRVVASLPIDGRSYRAARWRRAIAVAKRHKNLDLVVRPTGSRSRRALLSYIRLVKRLVPGDRTPPSSPRALAVAGTGLGSVTLAWTPARDNAGVAGYGLYRDGSYVGSVSEPTARFGDLSCARHALEVDAVDRAGNRSAKRFVTAAPAGCASTLGGEQLGAAAPAIADASQSLVGDALPAEAPDPLVPPFPTPPPSPTATPSPTVTPAPSPAPDRQPPSVPQGMAWTTATQTSIGLRWNGAEDDTGVAGYRLYRNGSAAGTTQNLSFTVANLQCGTSYTISLEAYDAAGNASNRAEAEGTTSTAACPQPSPTPSPSPTATPSPTPAPDAGSANVWVDANGGRCARASSRTTYSDPDACGSLDAAYDVAACGDLVVIRNGTYGRQNVSGPRSCAQPTLMIAQEKGKVLTGAVYVSGADDLVIRGITTTEFGSANPFIPTSQREVGIFSSSNVSIEDSDFGGFNIADANGGVALVGNDIGPCDNYDSTDPGGQGLESCTNGKINHAEDVTDGVTIANNYIHDFRCDQRDLPNSFTNGTGDNDCHWECMWVNASKNVTITGNHYANCDATAQLFLTMFAVTHGYENLTVENNWFGTGGSTAYGIAQGHCENWGGSDLTNVRIRFNTFSDSRRFATDENGCTGRITATGNIFKKDAWAGCASYITWEYNVFVSQSSSGMCGTGAKYHGTSLTGLVVNPGGDLHLAGAAGSTVADDLVPRATSGGCPATDYDKAARPAGNCDAGADAR